MAQPQVQQFHNFMDFTPAEQGRLPGIVAPQRVYVPPPSQQGGNPLPTIKFDSREHVGIRLEDALQHRTQGLLEPTRTPAMSTTGVRVAMRILWPCYDVWTTNMPICDHTPNANAFNMVTIAHRVASVIRDFYNDMSHVAVNPNADGADWGVHRIPFSQLYLVELRHVSQGSWQPVVCFRARQ